MKKGQGLSMNVIIVAAIALVVLVVLVVLVLNQGGNLANATACEQTGGSCISFPGEGSIADYNKACDEAGIGTLVNYNPANCGQNQICCLSLNNPAR
jgi:hypothetical protein